MLQHHESIQADSMSADEAQAELPPLLRVPPEVLDRVFHYILPSGTCLRIHSYNPSYDLPTPRVRMYPDGPALYLTTCRFTEHSNTSAGRLLRDCVYWDGACFIDKGIFGTSQALQSEAIAYLFRHNTLGLEAFEPEAFALDYTRFLGPLCREVTSVLVKTPITQEGFEKYPEQKGRTLPGNQISAITAHFPTLTYLVVCVDVCCYRAYIEDLDKDYALSVFRAAGRYNAVGRKAEVKVEMARCQYHPVRGRHAQDGTALKVYLDEFEAKCMEELENAQHGV